MAAETMTPQTTAGTSGRWSAGRITALVLAVLAAAAIAVMAFTLAGQSAQIGALRTSVASATSAAAGAQHKADQASTAATAAGKTQAAADNANLGVCVSTTYDSGNGASWVSGVTITSPVKSPGGAVSCYSGTFTPVTPQKAPPAG